MLGFSCLGSLAFLQLPLPSPLQAASQRTAAAPAPTPFHLEVTLDTQQLMGHKRRDRRWLCWRTAHPTPPTQQDLQHRNTDCPNRDSTFLSVRKCSGSHLAQEKCLYGVGLSSLCSPASSSRTPLAPLGTQLLSWSLWWLWVVQVWLLPLSAELQIHCRGGGDPLGG